MNTILVTGGTGFLGLYVIDELRQKGYRIITIGRNHEKGRKLNSTFVEFIKCDFTDKNELEAVFLKYNFKYVVHAGALSTNWGKWQDFYRTNVEGTENIAELCLKYSVEKMVYISSPSIYTAKVDKLNILESEYDKFNKFNYYIKSKLMAEEVIKKYAKLGLYNVILRPRGLFGVGDTSIIPRLLSANTKRGIPIIDSGINYIDITCVENVAYAIRLCVEKNDINNEVFNITNDEPMRFINIINSFFDKMEETPKYAFFTFNKVYFLASLIEIVYKMFRIREEPFITKYSVCVLGKSQTMNIDNAKNKLGYSPIMSIEEGISKYVKNK